MENLAESKSDVKVVTFGGNPSALSLEKRVKFLMEENAQLKAKIEAFTNEKEGTDTGCSTRFLSDTFGSVV